jgi:hypothetical protein
MRGRVGDAETCSGLIVSTTRHLKPRLILRSAATPRVSKDEAAPARPAWFETRCCASLLTMRGRVGDAETSLGLIGEGADAETCSGLIVSTTRHVNAASS